MGAHLVPFAGFAMPVRYGSILEEHRAVRERAGLFDVSHMGQFSLEGGGAEASLETLLTCPVSTLAVGQVRYGLLCNRAGGVVDDVTVYRRSADTFFLCVNAANIDKDYRWVESQLGPDTMLRNGSDDTALLALQGPASRGILEAIGGSGLESLRRFRFVEGRLAGRPCTLSRTGYTGSDGFELYLQAADAPAVFEALLETGAAQGLEAAGLGARDTLRLEAALPLYGHELDDDTTPFEAGLDRFVKSERGGFLGAEALMERALSKRLIGFILEDRGVARADYALCSDGREIGRVTSGAPSPTLGKSIGLGYVPPAFARIGTRIEVAVRDRLLAATQVSTPFVKKVGATQNRA